MKIFELNKLATRISFAAALGAVSIAAGCQGSGDGTTNDDGASGGATLGSGGSGENTVGGAGGAPSGSGGAPAAPEFGADVPFYGFEAEAGALGGGAAVVRLDAAPTTRFSSPELEASGHAYVALTATGDYVEWTNTTGVPITFVNVRASIPDAPAGGGVDAELDLLVDGVFRQKISLTSRQTWGYEGNDHYNAQTQSPSDGNPRTFWDDSHAFLDGTPLAPGSKLRLQKGAGSSADFYWLDVADLEAPPAPLPKPDGALSLTDFGVVEGDPNTDNSDALQAAIDAAEVQGKVLFIPEGTFYFRRTGGLDATGITIVGAGMWYSRLYRNVVLPNGTPLGAILNLDTCHVSHFALDSNAVGRDMVDGGGGGMDTTGTDWSADGIWTQHTLSGFWASGDGGTVENCRLLSIWADGCNVNNVSRGASIGRNLTVTNNFVRGTGDDAIAINSVDYNGDTTYTPMENVTISHNTSMAMWGGKGVAVYGGSGHVVERNYIQNCARYIGLGVGKFGVNGSDLTSANVRDNVVVACGGNAYEQQQPALHVGNGGDGQGVGSVAGAVIERNLIKDSLYSAVGFSTSTNITFSDNVIEAPGLDGIVISPDHYPAPTGSATLENNSVTNLPSGRQAFVNLSDGYQVTPTGNSWQ